MRPPIRSTQEASKTAATKMGEISDSALSRHQGGRGCRLDPPPEAAKTAAARMGVSNSTPTRHQGGRGCRLDPPWRSAHAHNHLEKNRAHSSSRIRRDALVRLASW